MNLKMYLAIACITLTIASCSNEASTKANEPTINLASEHFKIWGNCEMCKETIEGSLKVAGVQKADWNKDTKIMTITFDSTRISLDQIEKEVAAVGYDTEKYKGDDKAYSELPECCQYKRR